MPRFTRYLLLLLLLATTAVHARVRAVSSPLDRARKILVVIAHPDDEVLLAPLLAKRCIRGGASCSFLVMTSGEAGVCVRAGGCAPSVGDIRAAEMTRSAALFHASLTQWTFPDVLDGVDAAWSAHAGGRDVLLRRLSDAIVLEAPDAILTFDPEHGTTGHAAHKTIASLVLESGARNVWMLETIARFEGDRFVLSSARPDASVVLGDWELVVADAMLHESQFTEAQLESLRTMSEEQRRVWWLAR
ncbi:MAG TPA: PIG-L family deacetylase [Thermoanaerobaculia bacterium]|nr:PIG-L family deacetylase [Thermoanaerobaculia bacterium]